jgi:Phosphotransferase enzyme family
VKPEAVASAERILGSAATTWTRVTSGGWSVNEHWIVVLADGRRAFLKHSAPMEPCPTWLRDERAAYDAFEGSFAPQVLGWQDGARPLLVLEDLSPGAHWPPPWRPGDVDAVLEALREVAAAQVFAALPRLADEAIGGWPAVARDPEPFLRLELVSRAWLDAALPRLLDAWEATPIEGDALLHCDVRGDNLCLRAGRAIIFDWSHARIGNPDFDIAFWLPSLALEGGPQPDVFGVDGFAVYVAGFFAALAGLPPPEGAPHVRGFQLAQLEIALPWACRALGLTIES